MRYIFIYILIICSSVYGLEKSLSKRLLIANEHTRYTQEPALSLGEKNTRQIQLDDIGSALIKALKECLQPEKIQIHLNNWNNLKTYEVNITTSQIDEIIITARTMEEIARQAIYISTENSGLRSSLKVQFTRDGTSDSSPTVQKYINAQLNYDKICNHLGIKK